MFNLQFSKSVICACLLAAATNAAPAAKSSSATTTAAATAAASSYSVIPVYETVRLAPEEPNTPIWGPESTGTPLPMRGSLGGTVLGPHNVAMSKDNPDLLAPPTTDTGGVLNAKWPMGLSPTRLQNGGWARVQNIDVLPIAKDMSGVNMRLEAGAMRELHWHRIGEWSYIMAGEVQVTAVDLEGRNYVATVGAGDLWYFPPGVPHSLQATTSSPDGAEFMLVFDDGAFTDSSSFLLTDWLAHVPKEVLAKNFQTTIEAFDKLPGKELYIFPAPLAGDDATAAPVSPYGTIPEPYTFEMSKMNATKHSGGSVKIVDSKLFKISKSIAVAEVTVDPGAMRELHWHPTQDEWSFFLEGQARVTLFAAHGAARTFNYVPGDVGYVPGSFGHYVENIGNTTLRFLEIFKTDTFQDVSLSQWLALTPPELVKAHLGIDDETMKHLSKIKPVIVGKDPIM